MFKSLKLYAGRSVDLERFVNTFIEFGYKRQDAVMSEGDFSRRGEIIDIFPFTFELPVRIELEIDKVSSIKTFNPDTGQPLWEHQLVIILPIIKPSSFKVSVFKDELPVEGFLDLNIGDYVVHTEHGIGRFRGIDKIKIKDVFQDHFIIEYDRQEKLFVPFDQAHLIQKYIAFGGRRPRLNRLGTKEWSRVKDRARKGIQKLALEQLSLQAMRVSAKGFAFSKDTQWQRQFEETFPYKETPDQLKATDEVKQDMESAKPMDRLLCGDVGYGKTEVAMRAAFKAAVDNKQVAILVPTTILAEQHYHNFARRLKDFPINIQMLSRFRSDTQQKKVVDDLARGLVDIVIGTHRLLSDDIAFKDLGLLIIDEEQRFGVKAKDKLKSLKATCDVLTLTATPIPRTLYMSLMNIKDLSIIDTAPQNRLPIKTIVVEYDADLIRQAILRELKRKGQVYFVHNRVWDIEKVKDELVKLLPQTVRIGVGHGQMPPQELEQVMLDFLDGKIDVLVCTMIIQAGIDIPRVNTIIVTDAHTFGLADMHQLRGRVGRFNLAAYAYFTVPPKEIIESEAKKRLDAIQTHAKLGSGFNIAMEDLELRGAGNILGLEQHGFIAAVGFDLYCRLLREAINAYKKLGVYND